MLKRFWFFLVLLFTFFTLSYIEPLWKKERKILLITMGICLLEIEKNFIKGVQNIHFKCRFHIKHINLTLSPLFHFLFYFIPKRNITFKWRNLREWRNGGGEMWTFSTLQKSIHEKFISWRFLCDAYGCETSSMIAFVCEFPFFIWI